MAMTDRGAGADRALEALFAAARAEVPGPGQDLFDRVLALGLAAQPQPASRALPPIRAARSGWWDALWALGGWRGLGGLSSAMALGLVVGLAGIAEIPFTDRYEALDLMPGADNPFADSTEEN